MVWQRIQEAVDTHRLLPDIDRPALLGNAWPTIVRDWMAYQNTEPPDVVETPTQEMAQRCAEALSWRRWVRMHEWTTLLYLARGASQSFIARRLRLKRRDSHLVEVYRDHALSRIAAMLNA